MSLIVESNWFGENELDYGSDSTIKLILTKPMPNSSDPKKPVMKPVGKSSSTPVKPTRKRPGETQQNGEDSRGKKSKVSNKDGRTEEKIEAMAALDEPMKDEQMADEKDSFSAYPRLHHQMFKTENSIYRPLSDDGSRFLKENMSLIGSSKAKDLDIKWRNLQGEELGLYSKRMDLQVEEFELYSKRMELIAEQSKLLVDAVKSSKDCKREANGFNANKEYLPSDQPLLIPFDCKCKNGVFGAELTKTTAKGKSFNGIVNTEVKLLLSYPVSESEIVSNLVVKFNTTPEGIVFANNSSASGFKADSLVPCSTILIPLRGKPLFGSLEKPSEPGLGYPAVVRKHKRKSKKMWKIGLYIALSGVAFWISIAIGKVSFANSQDRFEAQIIKPTPLKVVVEAFTLEELRKATKEFSSINLIEDSVFHGQLNGKNIAIKCTKTETVSKVEFGLFHDSVHHHPNIIRLLVVSVAEEGGARLKLGFRVCEKWAFKELAPWWSSNEEPIHCFLLLFPNINVKSRNIFLDEEFNAKVGNFAPEYLHHGVIASSIDILSYGVIFLEVLSGQLAISWNSEKKKGSVWLSEKIKFDTQTDNAEELREWMDNALGENYSFDAAVTIANIARSYVEDDPSLRPNAGEIVEKLSGLVKELPE
ncbi:hypothetical protein LguiA_007048 [Lonicera macranthoides]